MSTQRANTVLANLTVQNESTLQQVQADTFRQENFNNLEQISGLSLVRSVTTPSLTGSATSVKIKRYGTILGLMNDDNVVLFDISSPTNPTEKSSVDVSAITATDFHIQNNYLFVAGGTNLNSYDISDLSSPGAPNNITISSGSHYLSGNNGFDNIGEGVHIFLASDSPDLVETFDISTPTTPTEVVASELDSGDGVDGPTFLLYNTADQYLYISNTGATESIMIVNASDPGTSMIVDDTLLAADSVVTPQHLAISGNSLYSAMLDSGRFVTYDVSTKTAAVEGAKRNNHIDSPISIYANVDDNILIIGSSTGGNRLAIYDISTTSAPALLESIRHEYSVVSVISYEGLIYVLTSLNLHLLVYSFGSVTPIAGNIDAAELNANIVKASNIGNRSINHLVPLDSSEKGLFGDIRSISISGKYPRYCGGNQYHFHSV